MTERKMEWREFTVVAGPPGAAVGSKEILRVPVVKR